VFYHPIQNPFRCETPKDLPASEAEPHERRTDILGYVLLRTPSISSPRSSFDLFLILGH